MSNIRFPFGQEIRKLLVDRQDGTYAERVEAYPPKFLLTNGATVTGIFKAKWEEQP